MSDLLNRLDAMLGEDELDEAKLRQVYARARFSVDQLAQMAKSHAHMKDWYDHHQEAMKRLVGDDHHIFNLCLAVTSSHSHVGGNFARAVDAYHHLITNKPYEGGLPDHRRGIATIQEGIRKGHTPMQIAQRLTKSQGSASEKHPGSKIVDYAKALLRHPDAPGTIDMHMAGILFGKYPTHSPDGQMRDAKLTPLMRRHGHRILKAVSDKLGEGWDPTKVQAALWSAHFPMYRKWAERDIKKHPQVLKKHPKTGEMVWTDRRPPTDEAQTYSDYIPRHEGRLRAIRAQHGSIVHTAGSADAPIMAHAAFRDPVPAASEAVREAEERNLPSGFAEEADEYPEGQSMAHLLLQAMENDPTANQPIRANPEWLRRQQTASENLLDRINKVLGG